MASSYSLAADEIVAERVGRHPFSLAAPFVSAAACVVAALALPALGTALSRNGLLLPIGFYGLVSVLLLGLAALIIVVAIFMFRANYLVLTNQNLIIVEQRGLFTRHVSQSSLANLEDVRAAQSGVAATIFKYGVVDIQTASEDQARFNYAPRPTELADRCLQAHVDFIKAHPDWR